MAARATSIIVDWGTTSLRAALVGNDGAELEHLETADGISSLAEGQHEPALMSALAPWFSKKRRSARGRARHDHQPQRLGRGGLCALPGGTGGTCRRHGAQDVAQWVRPCIPARPERPRPPAVSGCHARRGNPDSRPRPYGRRHPHHPRNTQQMGTGEGRANRRFPDIRDR